MTIDKTQIIKDLIADESKRLQAYPDSLRNPTVGIGHLIKSTDIIEIGDTISEDHCKRLFLADLDEAIDNCYRLYKDFDAFPAAAQAALVNMMFNMGIGNMMAFHNFNAAVESKDWAQVADFLRNNFKTWYVQVGDRAKRVENKFRQAIRQ